VRILITEEALQSGKGHWLNYIQGIAEGFRAVDDHIDVLVHRNATDAVIDQVGGTRWFSRNCWHDKASQGWIGGIRHNLTFRRELAGCLGAHEPYDWVCALTMRLQHLLAFALLARRQKKFSVFSGSVSRKHSDTPSPSTTGPLKAQPSLLGLDHSTAALDPRPSTFDPSSAPRFLLLFVQGFGRYAGHGMPTEFPLNGSTLLARSCFWLMRGAVQKGSVVLAAETKGMQDELHRFTGLPVRLFPHPIQSLKKVDRPSTLAPRPSTPITLTCPGFARHEKGSDLLQEAIKSILAKSGRQDSGVRSQESGATQLPVHISPLGREVRFVLQWPEAFVMPDGTILGPDPALLNDPRVEFLNRNLPMDEYQALLARTDLVILPYRRNSYHNRVSRVSIEAAGRGIPLIYTSGTWSGEVADTAGGGVPILDETSEAVAVAISIAIAQFDELKEKASKGAVNVSRFHSVGTFRDGLVGV